jgi:hypothetical protein
LQDTPKFTQIGIFGLKTKQTIWQPWSQPTQGFCGSQFRQLLRNLCEGFVNANLSFFDSVKTLLCPNVSAQNI